MAPRLFYVGVFLALSLGTSIGEWLIPISIVGGAGRRSSPQSKHRPGHHEVAPHKTSIFEKLLVLEVLNLYLCAPASIISRSRLE